MKESALEIVTQATNVCQDDSPRHFTSITHIAFESSRQEHLCLQSFDLG